MNDSQRPEPKSDPKPGTSFDATGAGAAPGRARSEDGDRISGRKLLAIVGGVTLAVVLVLIISGGNDDLDARLSEVSIVDAGQLPDPVLDDETIAEHGEDTPERTFLTWWRALQFRAWPEALSLMDPEFRRAVGAEAILDGFLPNIAYYPVVRPEILSAETTGPDAETIRYAVGTPDGESVNSNSVLMVRGPGGWLVGSDSALADSIRAGIEERIRVEEDPAAQVPPPRAIQEGRRATARINAYLASHSP